MDCRFRLRERIISTINSTATPKTKPTDISNKPPMTNITKPTPTSIRKTTVAANGARLAWFSFHKVVNSTE